MFKQLILPFLALLILSGSPVEARDSSDEFDRKAYLSGAYKEITKTEKYLVDLFRTYQADPINPRWNLLIRQATATLEAKHLLYSNYYDSPALENGSVRNFLLSILQQRSVNNFDLLRMENVMMQYEAYQAANAEAEVAPPQESQAEPLP